MENIEDINYYLHDSVILNYTVDFKEKTLTINTEDDNFKINEVIFRNYLAHSFNNVVIDNIIFDIEEVSIENFIESNKKFLEDNIKYGFPSLHTNEGMIGLKNALKDNEYKVFEISSSLGLNGFIIAKEVTFIKSITKK